MARRALGLAPGFLSKAFQETRPAAFDIFAHRGTCLGAHGLEFVMDKLDERCGGLLEAQAAYAQAVRSIDPHWAAMSGYRVGEMYQRLHDDLMQIPPPATSKTPRQKEIFFAFMHIRYRVLLEKGLKEIVQTVALGERTSDSSAWIQRAREAKEEMETTLADEKAQIAKMPFTEAEVNAALDQLKAKVTAKGTGATGH